MERERPVAIVGGSGFIGSNIAITLAAAGKPSVVLDTEPPSADLSHVAYAPFDLTRRSTWPADWSAFGAVVIAAGFLARGCAEQPQKAWMVNVGGPLSLVEALAASSSQLRVIFLSSGMVYDGLRASPPFVETAPTLGACFYTTSKLCVEEALRLAAEAGMCDALVLRPFTVFGTGALAARKGHLFGAWLEAGCAGKVLPVHGDGTQVIDAVPVEYVAAACLAYLAGGAPAPFKVVNVTSGHPIHVGRLAELFIRAGLAPGVGYEPAPPGQPRRGWGDKAALEDLLRLPLPDDPETRIIEFLDTCRGKPKPV